MVKSRLNAASHVQLICHTLKQDGERLCGNNFIFQQDGAPCQTAGSTKAWFGRKNIEVIPWTSQSPDLNPIDHIWEEMKAKLENKPCKGIDELKSAIIQCWQDIDSSTTSKLVSSILRCCAEVIVAHGGHTKY